MRTQKNKQQIKNNERRPNPPPSEPKLEKKRCNLSRYGPSRSSRNPKRAGTSSSASKTTSFDPVKTGFLQQKQQRQSNSTAVSRFRCVVGGEEEEKSVESGYIQCKMADMKDRQPW